MNQTEAQPEIANLLTGAVPGVEWEHGDDLCDCVFQRIGEWTNPYLGKTMRIRLCCLSAKLDELFPGLVQHIDGFFDINSGTFVQGQMEWGSLDADMPRAMWYRQLAARSGQPLAEIRAEYADQDPPSRLIPAPTQAQLEAIVNAPTVKRKRFWLF